MTYPFYLAENFTALAAEGNLPAFTDLVERNFTAIMNARTQTATVKWLRVVQLEANIVRAVLRAGGKPQDLFVLSESFLERISKTSVHDQRMLKHAILEFSREAFKQLPGQTEIQSGVAQRFLKTLDDCSLQSASVKSFAQSLRVSPSHLCREVRRATGSTPAEHIRRVKLAWARRELSRESVTSIALDLGFGKVSTFIALFRKEYGETPGTYKRRLLSARQ